MIERKISTKNRVTSLAWRMYKTSSAISISQCSTVQKGSKKSWETIAKVQRPREGSKAMRHLSEIGTKNQYQKTGSGF